MLHNRKRMIGIAVAAGVVCIVVAVCLLANPARGIKSPTVQEYVPGTPGILGTVDKSQYERVSPDFAIGADQYGQAVFKEPYKAFDTMVELYAEGIALIQRENALPPISRREFSAYKKFGWQVTTGDAAAQEQAGLVTKFLDIYENSFIEEAPLVSNEVPATEAPLEGQDFDAFPATYVSYQCIHMNPLSSFAALGGDSGCQYIIGEDFFAEINRASGATFRTDADVRIDEIEAAKVDVPAWAWKPFPYTDAEWAALYVPGMNGIANISERYDEILYQPLTSRKFLLRVDGELWLVQLGRDPKMGTYLWSIYSLVPEDAMGVARWEFAPLLSSGSPAFQFAFDLPYTKISAVCTESLLIDFGNDGAQQSADHGMTYTAGNALCWSPMDADGNIVERAEIHFTVHGENDLFYAGTIYITATGDDQGRQIYTASLVGTGLHLSPHTKSGGGIISAVGAQARFPHP